MRCKSCPLCCGITYCSCLPSDSLPSMQDPKHPSSIMLFESCPDPSIITILQYLTWAKYFLPSGPASNISLWYLHTSSMKGVLMGDLSREPLSANSTFPNGSIRQAELKMPDALYDSFAFSTKMRPRSIQGLSNATTCPLEKTQGLYFLNSLNTRDDFSKVLGLTSLLGCCPWLLIIPLTISRLEEKARTDRRSSLLSISLP